MSTESGIPDYRGSNGSYFRGHRPIIRHEYMTSSHHRRRYWARSLIGYSPFANAMPNVGHAALAILEDGGYIGVNLGGCDSFDDLGISCVGGERSHADDNVDARDDHMSRNRTRRISVITQNVDNLHSRAGVRHCLHLHGRGDVVRCMHCGYVRDRMDYHDELTSLNRDWLREATASSGPSNGTVDAIKDGRAELRPDGDAELNQGASYDRFILPPCSRCADASNEGRSHDEVDIHRTGRRSFFKTDVVFFGDSVPRHRFDVSYAAVDAADGILCIGTSLTVHSAYRLVRRGIERGTRVAILNVGETRVEKEGLGGDDGLVTKLESPIGQTLNGLVRILDREKE
jgi:NAD-dependent deacetylase sirtuin 4